MKLDKHTTGLIYPALLFALFIALFVNIFTRNVYDDKIYTLLYSSVAAGMTAKLFIVSSFFSFMSVPPFAYLPISGMLAH